jgi:hypothetical protein
MRPHGPDARDQRCDHSDRMQVINYATTVTGCRLSSIVYKSRYVYAFCEGLLAKPFVRTTTSDSRSPVCTNAVDLAIIISVMNCACALTLSACQTSFSYHLIAVQCCHYAMYYFQSYKGVAVVCEPWRSRSTFKNTSMGPDSLLARNDGGGGDGGGRGPV